MLSTLLSVRFVHGRSCDDSSPLVFTQSILKKIIFGTRYVCMYTKVCDMCMSSVDMSTATYHHAIRFLENKPLTSICGHTT